MDDRQWMTDDGYWMMDDGCWMMDDDDDNKGWDGLLTVWAVCYNTIKDLLSVDFFNPLKSYEIV